MREILLKEFYEDCLTDFIKKYFFTFPSSKTGLFDAHLMAFCCLACGYLNFSLSPPLQIVPDGREDEKELNC